MYASKTFHSGLRRWFKKPRELYKVLAGLVLVCLALLFIPATRYAILNTFGLRGSVSITVLDTTNNLPLKNVVVTIGKHTAKTNRQGIAKMSDIKLGRQVAKLSKLAFDSLDGFINVSAGDIKDKSFSLAPHGQQIEIVVQNKVGQGIQGAQVSYLQYSALTDTNGHAVLTIPRTARTVLKIMVDATGYRTETVNFNINSDTVVHLKSTGTN